MRGVRGVRGVRDVRGVRGARQRARVEPRRDSRLARDVWLARDRLLVSRGATT